MSIFPLIRLLSIPNSILLLHLCNNERKSNKMSQMTDYFRFRSDSGNLGRLERLCCVSRVNCIVSF